MPIRYTGSLGRFAYLNIGNGLISVPLENQGGISSSGKQSIEPNFNLKVYKLSTIGLPLINQNVSDGQTLDLSNFSSGTYVVHVNDTYVKKFRIGKINKQ